MRRSAIRRNITDLPFSPFAVVLALDDADRDTTREGMEWYQTAHEVAIDIAHRNSISVMQAAGVLAAYSPMTGWIENIRLASHNVESYPDIGGHTSSVCGKVESILQGEIPTRVLGGKKVRSFYRNILYPDRPGPVTVDRHAIDLLCGKRGSDSRILERVGVYTYATACFRGAARIAGIMPHQAQAIAWVHWRKIHDVTATHKALDVAGQIS